jgi:catechol 2,3-dioxygenase-like lactoylglutathione lyase family enzyme
MRLHHVQVSCPPGGEARARRFWGVGMGMTEVSKPPALSDRGGAWFRAAGGAEIHVGVEASFEPARKAHPALLLDSVAALESLGERLEAAGFAPDWSERRTFAGHERFHVADAHGNRVEVLAQI